MWSGLFSRRACKAGLATSLAAMTAACSTTSGTFDSKYGVSSSPRIVSGAAVPKGGGTYKLGSPYKVAERWYVPREDPGYDRKGIGSWYGDDFHGRKTANGEIFDMNALTAAHPTLPLPCYAYVTNLTNGRTILVRINDRGPYANDRIIDLSHASARALGYEARGTVPVRVRYAGRAPLNGDDRQERQFLAAQTWRGGNGPAVASVYPAEKAYSAPAESYDAPSSAPPTARWSPQSYRAAIAGKPAPVEFSPPPAPALTGALPQRAALGGYDPAAAASRSYVQVGIFRDRNNAERLRHDLASLGPVEIAALNSADGTFYRVRIGPLSNPAARAAQAEVSSKGLSGSTLVVE